jgi:hypothetical protein
MFRASTGSPRLEATFMDSKAITRKDFFTLTFTLIGGAAVAAGCSSSSKATDAGSSGGSTGSSSGGSTGASSGGSAGTDAGRDLGVDRQPDTGGVDTANSCASPLPAAQLPDATGHTHILVIDASTLSATTDQMLLTNGFPPDNSGGHFHPITLTVANLATLRAGTAITVTSGIGGTPDHTHMFMISCH